MRRKLAFEDHIGGERCELDGGGDRDAAQKPRQHVGRERAQEGRDLAAPGERRAGADGKGQAEREANERLAAGLQVEGERAEQIDRAAGGENERDAERDKALIAGNDEAGRGRDAAL